jgi:hypothetical protein
LWVVVGLVNGRLLSGCLGRMVCLRWDEKEEQGRLRMDAQDV